MSAGKRTDSPQGRFYTWRGEKFWSVTSLIGNGVPKPALVGWAAREVATAAVEMIEQVRVIAAKDPAAAIAMLKSSPYNKRDKAADLGSDIHAAVEAYTLGQSYTAKPEAEPYIRSFQAWLSDFSPVFEMSEASVYSRAHRYAGTLDAIVRLGDETVLVDWKTGKGVYPEVGMQLAAYSHAEFVGVGDQEVAMPATDGAAVVHLTPKGYEYVPVRVDEEVFRAFCYAREVARWQLETSKTVLGQARKGRFTDPIVAMESEVIAQGVA